jgi:hypothetical protein
MEKHFVTFLSPGTFVHEETTRPIDSWNPDAAVKMAGEIVERYGARPFCFYFTKRGRGPDDLDSKITARSGTYYLGGKIETLKQVKARATPKDAILISNMESNGYDRIITNTNSWSMTAPFGPSDVLLDVKLPAQGGPKGSREAALHPTDPKEGNHAD